MENSFLEGSRRRNVRASKTIAAAFTLIELLAVIGIVAVLSAVLLPALAGAKADNGRSQCALNQKQLGVGFRLFEQDHNEMFPPAAHSTGAQQLSWDSYIHWYIGGAASDSHLTAGFLGLLETPKILACPTDAPGKNPKVVWVGNPPFFGIRSYAMAGVGPNYGSEIQVSTSNQRYFLPRIDRGVGIYWRDSTGNVDWDAKSYRTSVVQDPVGTILLAEEPNGQGIAGNEWPCVSLGPDGTGNFGFNAMYQTYPQVEPQDPASSASVNQGLITYAAHGNRFNYLFHDNHVAALTTNQTVGTGTPLNPKGIWTLAAGD